MTRISFPAARTLIPILLLAALGAGAPDKPVSAPAAKSQAMPLRQQAIHLAYNEGDFDKVVAEIEVFTKANRTYSRADSVFIAKHLAVVYSANPTTREKGKYYMYRLLEMVPSAELVDMYVSDEIDRIFDKVRKEFLTRQKSFGVDSTQMSIPEKPAGKEASPAAMAASEPSPPVREEKPGTAGDPFYRKKGFWMLTGAGIAAIGAVATFIHSQDEGEGKTIPIGAP